MVPEPRKITLAQGSRQMITLETQFLIGLCFLCYLLFKSSSIPSVAGAASLDAESRQPAIERPSLQNLEVLDPPGSTFLDHREKGGCDLVAGAQEKDLNDSSVMLQGGHSKL